MELSHHLQLGFQFRDELPGERNSSILVSFSMNRKNSVLEIEILHSKAETLEKTKAATVEQADNGIERVFEMTQYNINFLPGKNDGYIF